MNNKLMLAGAGTGKTSFIVDEALKETDRVLITTFTIRCKDEINEKIIKQKGYIPKNIVVQTWFSFLLEHGIMPYKRDLGIINVNGLCFIDGKSGKKFIKSNGEPRYYGEKDFFKFYFDDSNRIYADKLAKLVLKIDEVSGGLVFNRISLVFKKIFIDEVQDMVGYDLDIIKKLADSNNELVIVGDPRQNIYNTHCDSKYDKYSNGQIDQFIINECKKNRFSIDIDTLNTCYRCYKDIVLFLNEFYPEYNSLNFVDDIPKCSDQGIFIVRREDLNDYLKLYKPIQLRYNKRTQVVEEYKSINYRNSKGSTYARTIIYPTGDLKCYLKSGKKFEKQSTKNAIYVALSRAIDSVGIVYDDEFLGSLKIKVWNNPNL
jgi:DNA helicase-2/ATP-dependent DNA helicase PcrA